LQEQAAAARHLLATTPAPASAVGACTALPDSANPKFVLVAMELDTTVGKIDDTWHNLNEYDLNRQMAKECLPPTVISYENIVVGSASMVRRSWVLVVTTLSVVLMMGN